MSIVTQFFTYLTNPGEILNSEINISNIKISVKVTKNLKILEKQDKCLSYFSKNNLIVKFNKYTTSVLGKNYNYLNFTGISHFEEISICVSLFFELFSELVVYTDVVHIKIDSISICFSTTPGLKYSLIQLFDKKFFITKPPKFAGLIIRNRNCKYSITYFSSGKCIGVGLKSLKDCNDIYLDVLTLINKASLL